MRERRPASAWSKLCSEPIVCLVEYCVQGAEQGGRASKAALRSMSACNWGVGGGVSWWRCNLGGDCDGSGRHRAGVQALRVILFFGNGREEENLFHGIPFFALFGGLFPRRHMIILYVTWPECGQKVLFKRKYYVWDYSYSGWVFWCCLLFLFAQLRATQAFNRSPCHMCILPPDGGVFKRGK